MRVDYEYSMEWSTIQELVEFYVRESSLNYTSGVEGDNSSRLLPRRMM